MQVRFEVPKEFFLKGIPCRIDLKQGQQVGNFIVEKILGNGTFGVVYKVRHGNQYFALKLLKLWEVVYKEQKETVGERFLREYYAAQTRGAYLVKSHQYGEIDNNPFFVMDYLQGGDLRSKIGKLTVEQIQSFGIDILHGLQELHGAGIIHRDLKPDNVLIDSNNKALLTDFGISAFVNHHIKRATRPNLFGNVRETFGTFAYIPPEQLVNAKKFATTTARTDLWAWGVMMYELFSNGNYPWGRLESESDLADYIKNANQGNMVDTSGFKIMPANWQQVVANCLKSDFGQRAQDASSILSLLSAKSFNKQQPIINAANSLKLTVLQGENRNLCMVLSPEKKIFNIGRSSNNDVYVQDNETMYISRQHATIECVADLNCWFVRDGQWNISAKKWQLSTNGTYLNSAKIDKFGAKLSFGDIITIGDTRLKVETL